MTPEEVQEALRRMRAAKARIEAEPPPRTDWWNAGDAVVGWALQEVDR